jgi:hypothetical protein
MNIDQVEALAELVGEPELIPFLDRCEKHTLAEVNSLLHSLVAGLGHPDLTYRARLRAHLINDIWDQVYRFNREAYMRWLILDRIERQVRFKGLHDLDQELWILANLWDTSGEDLDVVCEALEDCDWAYLREGYLSPTPSPEAVMQTAGRAIYYVSNGDMAGTVSTHEAIEYFGWEI